MKKILSFIALLILIACAAMFFYAKPQLEENLKSQLASLGFDTATINSTSIGIDGVSINKIQLDQDGFDFIENIHISVMWPEYLLTQNIKKITIGRWNLANLSEDLGGLTKNINTPNLNALQGTDIEISKIIWDISTTKGAIRVEGNADITSKEDQYKIKAKIAAEQHQLSFNSEWSGTFDVNNNIQLDAIIDKLSINYAPVGLNRGSGWLSYSKQGDDIAQVSSQLDSGSGSIYNVPAKNIALTIGTEETYYPILFRAQASGIEGVNISTDMHYADEAKDQAFMLSLNIDQPNDFFAYLTQLKIIGSRAALSVDEKTNLTIQYMPEKRFADGPIPFDMSVMETTDSKLDGTFLIYPSSLDLRGTAEGDEDFIKSLQSVFDINDDEIADNVLRIDGNLKSLLQ